ncbi:MAG TPA: phosphoribosyl-ATP diphosphatase [Alphaproteobacteria bacterium]|jgi:phosphoribosyl-ATP pyrophosphohydrolase|nr:phosphoribosyl-ATP diphosphatase [Alphaproteobacteria bacterium]
MTGAADASVITRVFEAIESRRTADPEVSYVAKLFSKGTPKIGQKVGEEAVETVIAAMLHDRREIVSESADLLFMLMVLWADAGVTPSDIYAELEAREGVSGYEAKKRRKAERRAATRPPS